MHKTQTAGAVVIGPEGRVLVVNQHGNAWSLPKGHVDPGETLEETAKREVKEESGVSQLEFIKKLGTYERYRIGKDGIGEDTSSLKEITFFLCTSSQKELKPEDPENPEARWVEIEEVEELLTHPKDKAFFRQIKNSLTV
jgi:ADP-ribose pyrophosphatase YjhB (NUDIX family)